MHGSEVVMSPSKADQQLGQSVENGALAKRFPAAASSSSSSSSTSSEKVVETVRSALAPFGVDIVEPLCLGWINDELAAAAARRARKRGEPSPPSSTPPSLLPSLPPSTLSLLIAHSRAAFESLASKTTATATTATTTSGKPENENEEGEGEEEGEDPLASHVSSAVDAALRAIDSLLLEKGGGENEAATATAAATAAATATVVWRSSSSSVSSAAASAPSPVPPSPPSSSSTAVAVAAALACGWAQGSREIGVPCVSPRFGPWTELAAVIVVGGGGGCGGGGGGGSGSGNGNATTSASTSTTSASIPTPLPPILHSAPRPARAARRSAAVCPSALAYSRLVSRGSSGFNIEKTSNRLSPPSSSSPPSRLSPSPSPSPSPPTTTTASSPLSASTSPTPVASAFAPRTPPLPTGREGQEEEEEDEEKDKMIVVVENDFNAAVVAKMTEARSALSPGHIFSYPPLMLRYLYSPDPRARAGALREAREAAAARGKVHF